MKYFNHITSRSILDWSLASLGPVFIGSLQWLLWSLLSPFAWTLFYPAAFFVPWMIKDKKAGYLFVIFSTLTGVIFFLPKNGVDGKFPFSFCATTLLFFAVALQSVRFHHWQRRIRSADFARIKKMEKERLMSQEKMSNLGIMASLIVHEINNPLTVVTNKSSMRLRKISAGQEDPVGLIEDLEKIHKNGMRVAKILKSMKVFTSKDRQNPMTETSVQLIFAGAKELCREQLQKQNVDIQVDIPVDAIICGHSLQIERVLGILINNSLEAIAQVESQEKAWIKLALKIEPMSELAIQITVTDSGAGLSEIVKQNLMKPFFTTKEEGKGLGLNLAIAKEIIVNHGGQFLYNPQSSHTQFVIALPTSSVHRLSKAS